MSFSIYKHLQPNAAMYLNTASFWMLIFSSFIENLKSSKSRPLSESIIWNSQNGVVLTDAK
jgi:hypothetical protein